MPLVQGIVDWRTAWREAPPIIATEGPENILTGSMEDLAVMDQIIIEAIATLQPSGFRLIDSLPTYMKSNPQAVALDAAFEAALANSQAQWIATSPPNPGPPMHPLAVALSAIFKSTMESAVPASASSVGLITLATAVGNNIYTAYPTP